MNARPRVYVEDCHEPPMAAGNGMPERVLALGGEPFSRRLGEGSEKVSWEELLEFNPQVVIYMLGKDFDPAEFYRTEGFAILEAGKQRRVYSVGRGVTDLTLKRLILGVELEAETGNCRFLE